MRLAARLERIQATPWDGDGIPSHYRDLTKPSKAGPVWTGRITLAPDHIWTAPLRRKKPTMYFVNSMGDVFHDSTPRPWIDRVFAVMAMSPQHTFLVLTKRADRMRAYINDTLYGRGRYAPNAAPWL